MFDYIHDPKAIYAASFATVDAETDLSGFDAAEAAMARRLVHACGMPDIVPELRFGGDPVAAGRRALNAGADILVDAEMVAAGIIGSRLPKANAIHCTLNDATVPDLAAKGGTTRSAAAVDLWRNRLAGAVVAIGNAPTALFRLLEVLVDGAPVPAVVLGFPVGFVGARESKAALVEHAGGIPFVTLLGRRGGSALAAAAINALSGNDEFGGSA